MKQFYFDFSFQLTVRFILCGKSRTSVISTVIFHETTPNSSKISLMLKTTEKEPHIIHSRTKQ